MGNSSREFICECRKRGRLTIDEAVAIADRLGVFGGENADAMLAGAKKQKVRNMLGHAKDEAGHGPERALRSVRVDGGRVYVDLFNRANRMELNLLIQNEDKKIQKSQKIIRSLKRIRSAIDGQITIEEVYGNRAL